MCAIQTPSPGVLYDLVYLTGFMASGKSTIGPILANTLGYGYADIDVLIVQTTGKRIPDFFAQEGEAAFRAMEQEILRDLSTQHRMIISLGGGTLASDDNMRLIKSTGLLIYLKSDPEHIFKRVRYKTDRPLLLDKDGTSLDNAELRERIDSILAMREPYYRQADITIRTDERRVGLTVDEIVRALKHRLA